MSVVCACIGFWKEMTSSYVFSISRRLPGISSHVPVIVWKQDKQLPLRCSDVSFPAMSACQQRGSHKDPAVSVPGLTARCSVPRYCSGKIFLIFILLKWFIWGRHDLFRKRFFFFFCHLLRHQHLSLTSWPVWFLVLEYDCCNPCLLCLPRLEWARATFACHKS